jgi:hypothetical protein
MSNVGEELPDGQTAFGTRTKTCMRCMGAKTIPAPPVAGHGNRQLVECPACKGTGTVPKAAYER